MRKVIVALLVLIMAGSLSARSVTFPESKKFPISHGFVIIKENTSVYLYPNGTLKSGILAQPLQYRYGRVANMTFQPGKRISFHQDGSVESGYLAKSTIFRTRYGTFRVGRGKYISIRRNHRLHRINFDGINFIKGYRGNKHFAVKRFIIFSKKGLPERTYLVRDTKFKKYILKGNTQVAFHGTGHVQSGWLARTVKVRKGRLKLRRKTYKAGRRYLFNKRGDIK